MMKQKILSVTGLTFALALGFANPALAEDVVIQRNVTVRKDASRASTALAYPAIGTHLELLDEGGQVRGYYHVKLADGRSGWVYRTFVRREGGTTKSALLPASARMAVHYINVDQGNAALVEFPCGDVLIDAGGRGLAASDHLIAYLDAFFARRRDLNRRIDAIFVTHTHVDHNSNLRRIAERYGVRGYIHNGLVNGSGRANAQWMLAHAPGASPAMAVEAITQKQIDHAGTQGVTDSVIDPVSCIGTDPQIKVLSGGFTDNPDWPDGEFENGNNHSLVVRIDFGKASFLFTGDLEVTGIETLVARYASTQALNTDVWEVSHHGSYNGTTPALLSAISPRIAVISMGPSDIKERWTAWAYGHPRKAVVNALVPIVTDNRRVPKDVLVAERTKVFAPYRMAKAIYATGWDGDIVITADAAGKITSTLER